MKKTKRNYVIIALIIVLLSLAIGYAVMNDQLEISGTANVKGTFDLEFRNQEILTSDSSNGVLAAQGSRNATLDISEDKDTLSAGVELQYPGAGQAFSVDIYNNSTSDAICEAFRFSGDIVDDPDVDVYFPKTAEGWEEGQIIPSKTSKKITFYVKWKEDSTYMDETGKSLNFTATFDYKQKVDGTEQLFTGDTANYKVQEEVN